MPKFFIWALPEGEDDRLYERPLTSFAVTREQAARVKSAASLDGWHSFRLVEDTLGLPDFAGAVRA